MIFRSTAHVIPIGNNVTQDDPFGDYSHLVASHVGIEREQDYGCAISCPRAQTAYYKIRRNGDCLVPITKEDFDRIALSNFLSQGTFLPATNLDLNPK
jgi:hypothetical protein